MENLTVDAEGKVVIPREIIERRGLRPGDTLALVEAAEGLLVYQGGTDLETLGWWNRLSEDERCQAKAEARQSEVLNEEARELLQTLPATRERIFARHYPELAGQQPARKHTTRK
ncbi:MAG: AbrB/MazE/SpoVT family DNA-binding domain-containing protein [Candidatus Binatia bacterium]